MAAPVTRRVDTRRSATSARALIKSIASTLQLKTRQRQQFLNLFAGSYAHSYYTQAHKAYMTKANGGTDNLGNHWPPITPATKARKKQNKNKTLIETHVLEKSLRPGTRTRWSYRTYNHNQIYRFNGKSITLGSKDFKIKFHQEGTPRMPARPPFPTNARKWAIVSARQGAIDLRDRIAIEVTKLS